MNLNALVTKSDPIYLADVSKKFTAFEDQYGGTEVGERIAVVVRTASSEDTIKRKALYAKRETKYNGDDQGRITSISEVFEDNPEYRKMMECYYTVESISNLVSGEKPNEKPVFDKPLRDIPVGEFIKRWGALPPELTEAVHLAVIKHNPTWDPARLGE